MAEGISLFCSGAILDVMCPYSDTPLFSGLDCSTELIVKKGALLI
jgi:hypothetical protein